MKLSIFWISALSNCLGCATLPPAAKVYGEHTQPVHMCEARLAGPVQVVPTSVEVALRESVLYWAATLRRITFIQIRSESAAEYGSIASRLPPDIQIRIASDPWPPVKVAIRVNPSGCVGSAVITLSAAIVREGPPALRGALGYALGQILGFEAPTDFSVQDMRRVLARTGGMPLEPGMGVPYFQDILRAYQRKLSEQVREEELRRAAPQD